MLNARTPTVGRFLEGYTASRSVPALPEGPEGVREMVDAACANARALARLCDMLEPRSTPVRGMLEEPDGAFILPEEL